MNRLRRLCVTGFASLCLAGSAWGAPSVMGTLVGAAVAGDVNGDGITDFKDQSIVQSNLGKTGGFAMGDLTGDGLIDSSDLTVITDNFRARNVATYFGKIADTNTTVPSSAAKFYQFNAPVMDRSAALAFFGNGLTDFGIYRASGTGLLKVVDSNTVVPGGNRTYNLLNDPSVVGNKIVFMGKDENLINSALYGDPGIYSSVNGAAPAIVVNKNTAKPGGGTFAGTTDMGDPQAAGNLAIFSVGSTVYGVTGTVVSKVVDNNTLVPGSATAKFSSFGDLATDGTNFYFLGQGGSQFGIYKKAGSTISPLLDGTTPIPGTTAKFTYLSNLANDGANFAFFGTVGGSRDGVYALIDNAVRKVADTAMSVPGGTGRFTGFGLASIGGSSVAFVGYDQKTRPGLYAWIDNQLVRVLDTHMTLEGKRISGLEIGDAAVAGNRIAFKATFTDGTSGIYVASILAPWAPGDLNGDNHAAKTDFAIIMKNIGQPGTRAMGDLDGDGKISLSDLQIIERVSGLVATGPLLGDVDGNGLVDSTDWRIVQKNLGKYGTAAQGDFTLDGMITLDDLQLVERQMGQTAPAYLPFGAILSGSDPVTSIVPEPGACSAIVLLGSMLLIRRRR